MLIILIIHEQQCSYKVFVMMSLNFKEFDVDSCHEILIIHEQQICKARNDVIDCPYKEFSVIKLNQIKKV